MNKTKNIVALSIAILFSGCAAQVVSSGKLSETTNSLNKINIVFSQTHLSADDGDKSPYTESTIQEESAKFCEKVLDTVVTRFQPTKQCTEYEQPQGKMTGFWHNA